MSRISRSPSDPPRAPRPWKLVLALGCAGVPAVVVLAGPGTPDDAKRVSAFEAPRTEALAESHSERQAPLPRATPAERVAAPVANDDAEAFEEDAEDEDERTDPLEARLSAEILLLENRRRARDGLEALANSERLSAADGALLDARREALSAKLAAHEQRIELFRRYAGNDESGYEAQNGSP